MTKVTVLPPNSLKRPLDGARIVFMPRPRPAAGGPAGSSPTTDPDTQPPESSAASQAAPMRPGVNASDESGVK
jgi:hypothetical protein